VATLSRTSRTRVLHEYAKTYGRLFQLFQAGCGTGSQMPYLAPGSSRPAVTTANELCRPIHDHMPVIVHPDTWETWLTKKDAETASALLQPYPASKMAMYPVSKCVGNVKNDDPDPSADRGRTKSPRPRPCGKRKSPGRGTDRARRLRRFRGFGWVGW
jgi:SOS response associated peptidase (SRAP)